MSQRNLICRIAPQDLIEFERGFVGSAQVHERNSTIQVRFDEVGRKPDCFAKTAFRFVRLAHLTKRQTQKHMCGGNLRIQLYGLGQQRRSLPGSFER